ncbi:hypothetical protein RZS08_39280, partial [Arthrospira platensis SPKY1]|nr:hypothetical protein [Arthrospira platensis SPKY1]
MQQVFRGEGPVAFFQAIFFSVLTVCLQKKGAMQYFITLYKKSEYEKNHAHFRSSHYWLSKQCPANGK